MSMKNNRDNLVLKDSIRGYNLSWARYIYLKKAQNNSCAICKRPFADRRIGISKVQGVAKCIDHCHKTGLVRGLLCYRCNMGLGLFKDNVDILNQAIKYLKM
jgi:hypothetical protein